MTSSPTTEISPLQVTSSREGLEGGLRLPEKLLQQVRGESDWLTAWVIVSVMLVCRQNTNTTPPTTTGVWQRLLLRWRPLLRWEITTRPA